MPEASAVTWHLAHTTWFFETVVLEAHMASYRPFDQRYAYLFSSYYEARGPRHPRPQRGLHTRRSLDEVHRYRVHLDTAMKAFLNREDPSVGPLVRSLVELGLHHEQQHQELMLTDVKHLLSLNPLQPTYVTAAPAATVATRSEPKRADPRFRTVVRRPVRDVAQGAPAEVSWFAPCL